MTVFVTFEMGAKEAYFFNSPTHWAWHNLPPDVESLFTKQPPIKDVLELALGDNGTYFVSYRDHDGQVLCRHYNLPNPLSTYLYHSHPHVIRDLTTLSITLGPYESYYAHDKTSASWSNLPSALEKAVLGRLESQDAWKTVWKENGRDAPSFVNLGADGSYFMRTVGGGGSWDFKSKEDGMKGMNKFLEGSSDFTGIAGVYLFPHYPNCYVLLLTSGKTFSNLPEHTWADYNKLAAALTPLVQTSSPIPAVPQAPLPKAPVIQPQPQSQLLQNPSQHGFQPTNTPSTNCCPPSISLNNCCPPTGQMTVVYPAYQHVQQQHVQQQHVQQQHVQQQHVPQQFYSNTAHPYNQQQQTVYASPLPPSYSQAQSAFYGTPAGVAGVGAGMAVAGAAYSSQNTTGALQPGFSGSNVGSSSMSS